MDEGGAANTWGLWWVMKRREGEYSRVSKEGKEAVPVSEVEQGGVEVKEMVVYAVWVVGPQGMAVLLGGASDRR